MEAVESRAANLKSGNIVDMELASSLALAVKKNQFVTAPLGYKIRKKTVDMTGLATILNNPVQQATQSKAVLSVDKDEQIIPGSVRFTYTAQVVVPDFTGNQAAWDITDPTTTKIPATNEDGGLIPPQIVPAERKVYLPDGIVAEQLSDVRCSVGDESLTVQECLYVQKKLSKLDYPVIRQLNEAFLYRRAQISKPCSTGLSDNYAAGTGAFSQTDLRNKFVSSGSDTIFIEEKIHLEGLTPNMALESLWCADHDDVNALPPGCSLTLNISTNDSASRFYFAEALITDVQASNTDRNVGVLLNGLSIEYDVLRLSPLSDVDNPANAQNRIKIQGPEELYGSMDESSSAVISAKDVYFTRFCNSGLSKSNPLSITASTETIVINAQQTDPVPDLAIVWVGDEDAMTKRGRQTYNRSYLRFAIGGVLTSIECTDFGETNSARLPYADIQTNQILDLTTVYGAHNALRLALNDYVEPRAMSGQDTNQSAFELISRQYDFISEDTLKGYTGGDGKTTPVSQHLGQANVALIRPIPSENINREFKGPRRTGTARLQIKHNRTATNSYVFVLYYFLHSVCIKVNRYDASAAPTYTIDQSRSTPYGLYAATKFAA